MSALIKYSISEFSGSEEEIRSYLEIILNTLFFNRFITNFDYENKTTAKFPNIAYNKIKNSELENEIKNKLEEIKAIDEYDSNIIKFTVTVNFYNLKRNWTWFFYQKYEGLWETWEINVNITDKTIIDKEEKARKKIFYMLNKLTSNDNMPDKELTDFKEFNEEKEKKEKKEENTFPYEIIVKRA